jgi:maltodextrin utilization protein YvdJ
MGHAAKAGSRAVVNASPEPFSNVVVSTSEDVTTTGLLVAALANPVLAIIIAVGVAIGSVTLILMVRRLLKKLMPSAG